jgi:hypothetical protein
MRGYVSPDWWEAGTRWVFRHTIHYGGPLPLPFYRRLLLKVWCNWVSVAAGRLGLIRRL